MSAPLLTAPPPTAPHALANAVIDDVQAGFRYLPDRDAEVVKDWLFQPYGF